jgi:hypothetical protein
MDLFFRRQNSFAKIGGLTFSTSGAPVGSARLLQAVGFESRIIETGLGASLKSAADEVIHRWGESIKPFVRNRAEASVLAYAFQDYPSVLQNFVSVRFINAQDDERASLLESGLSAAPEMKIHWHEIDSLKLLRSRSLENLALAWGSRDLESVLILEALKRTDGPVVLSGLPLWPHFKNGKLFDLRFPDYSSSSIYRFITEQSVGEPSLFLSNSEIISSFLCSGFCKQLLAAGRRGFSTPFSSHSLSALMTWEGISSSSQNGAELASSFKRGLLSKSYMKNEINIFSTDEIDLDRKVVDGRQKILDCFESATSSFTEQSVEGEFLHHSLFPRMYRGVGLAESELMKFSELEKASPKSKSFHQMSAFPLCIGSLLIENMPAAERLLFEGDGCDISGKFKADVEPQLLRAVKMYLDKLSIVYDKIEISSWWVEDLEMGSHGVGRKSPNSFFCGILLLSGESIAFEIPREQSPIFFEANLRSVNPWNAASVELRVPKGTLLVFPSALRFSTKNKLIADSVRILHFGVLLRGKMGKLEHKAFVDL